MDGNAAPYVYSVTTQDKRIVHAWHTSVKWPSPSHNRNHKSKNSAISVNTHISLHMLHALTNAKADTDAGNVDTYTGTEADMNK